MKKLGFTIFATAVLALPLCAQLTTSLRADIPFEFVVGNTTVPSGQYVVSARTGSPVVQLEGSKTYHLLSSTDESYTIWQEPKLIFHRYGNQYFLSRISTTSTGRDLPPSRVERELKKALAAARQMPTEIVLAMR
jgi:hypothetical protein